jgi:hypothetical protein
VQVRRMIETSTNDVVIGVSDLRLRPTTQLPTATDRGNGSTCRGGVRPEDHWCEGVRPIGQRCRRAVYLFDPCGESSTVVKAPTAHIGLIVRRSIANVDRSSPQLAVSEPRALTGDLFFAIGPWRLTLRKRRLYTSIGRPLDITPLRIGILTQPLLVRRRVNDHLAEASKRDRPFAVRAAFGLEHRAARFDKKIGAPADRRDLVVEHKSANRRHPRTHSVVGVGDLRRRIGRRSPVRV